MLCESLDAPPPPPPPLLLHLPLLGLGRREMRSCDTHKGSRMRRDGGNRANIPFSLPHRFALSSSTNPSPSSTASTPTAARASRTGSPSRRSRPRTHRTAPRTGSSPSRARHAALPCGIRGTMPLSRPCWTCMSPPTRTKTGQMSRRRSSRPSTSGVTRSCRSIRGPSPRRRRGGLSRRTGDSSRKCGR